LQRQDEAQADLLVQTGAPAVKPRQVFSHCARSEARHEARHDRPPSLDVLTRILLLPCRQNAAASFAV
jgi:hypothetical protein